MTFFRADCRVKIFVKSSNSETYTRSVLTTEVLIVNVKMTYIKTQRSLVKIEKILQLLNNYLPMQPSQNPLTCILLGSANSIPNTKKLPTQVDYRNRTACIIMLHAPQFSIFHMQVRHLSCRTLTEM